MRRGPAAGRRTAEDLPRRTPGAAWPRSPEGPMPTGDARSFGSERVFDVVALVLGVLALVVALMGSSSLLLMMTSGFLPLYRLIPETVALPLAEPSGIAVDAA